MKKLEQCIGVQYSTPAPGNTVSVDTPLAVSQRDLNETKWQQHLVDEGGLDWDQFGYITVTEFPNGKRVVTDGQHRLAKVKYCLPEVREVPALIVKGDAKRAAHLFDRLNFEGVDPAKSKDLFHSKCVRGDEFALQLKHLLEQTNFHIGKVNRQPHTTEIKYANFLKAVKFSETAFLRAAHTIDTVFPKSRAVDNLLSGMSRLFSIEEYQDLGNTERAVGKNFRQWLLDLKKVGATPKKLEFAVYRNNGPWYDAVAYGLARHFLAQQRGLGRKVPNVQTMENIWNKPVRDAKQKELDEISMIIF